MYIEGAVMSKSHNIALDVIYTFYDIDQFDRYSTKILTF